AAAGAVVEGKQWFGHIDLWEVPSGRRAGQVAECTITALTFSPDGATLATGNGSGAIQLWEAKTGKQRRADGGHVEVPLHAAFTPDGRTLLSASQDQTLRWWSVKDGRQFHQAESVPPSPYAFVALSPD